MMTKTPRLLAALGLAGLIACQSTGPKPPHSRSGLVSRAGFAWEWAPPPAAGEADAATLVARFADPDAAVRADAAWRLPAASPAAEHREALARLLDDKDDAVRDQASLAMFRTGLVDSVSLHPEGQPSTPPRDDEQPRILKMTRPVYPTDAAVQRVQGMVILQILVSATGRVLRARVEESKAGLDDAALLCVRQWQFEPAMKDGRAVPSVVYGEVKFRLMDSRRGRL